MLYELHPCLLLGNFAFVCMVGYINKPKKRSEKNTPKNKKTAFNRTPLSLHFSDSFHKPDDELKMKTGGPQTSYKKVVYYRKKDKNLDHSLRACKIILARYRFLHSAVYAAKRGISWISQWRRSSARTNSWSSGVEFAGRAARAAALAASNR
jgi:hypothetical protein